MKCIRKYNIRENLEERDDIIFDITKGQEQLLNCNYYR